MQADTKKAVQAAYMFTTNSAPTSSQCRNVKTSLVAIDEDIILLLSNSLSKKDLLSLMFTCRPLFRIGLPMLLRRDILIETTCAMLSFHDFLVFASPSSFLFLRTLDFPAFWYSMKEVHHEAMTDTLKRAPNLHNLGICAKFLEHHDLALTVISMRNLRHLSFHRVYDLSRPLATLTLLSSPLTRIHLTNDGPDDFDTVALSGIMNFSSTLEQIHFSWPTFSVPTFPPEIYCEKVTHLTITPCWKPLLSFMVSAFPSTQILVVELGYDYMEEHSLDPDPQHDATLVALREENCMFQRKQPIWTSLEFVKTDWESFYAMALKCDVVSLTITTSIFLEDLTPCLLRPILLHHLRFILLEHQNGLWDARVEDTNYLERLDVTMDLDRKLTTDQCQRTTLYLLNAFNLSRIRMLDFRCDAPSRIPDIWELWAPLDMKAWLDMSQEPALYALQEHPTLEFFRFAIYSEGDIWLQVYWKVLQADNRLVLEQVSLDDHDAIYAIDRMFIPPAAWEN